MLETHLHTRKSQPMSDPVLSRRDLLKRTTGTISLLGLSQAAFARPQSPAEAKKPMPLSPGVHLFLDDYLIARQGGLKRVISPPARLPQPIVTGREDGNFQPYLSVLRDP